MSGVVVKRRYLGLFAFAALGWATIAFADAASDEANRQRQMESMRAEASRNDSLNAAASLQRQQSTADAARAANALTPAYGGGSAASGGAVTGGAVGGAATSAGPQSVVDSYTITIRTQETAPQMIARLTSEAAAGDLGAQYNLGRIYYTGFADAPRNDAKARDYFRQAAGGGHAASQANYGYFLVQGIGGPVDRNAGERMLKAAADAGNSFGQAQYGMSLFSSDSSTASQYLIKAADAGEMAAQALMGTLFAIGEGVTRDDARAVAYLKAASDQGEIGSIGQLAGMYLTDRGGSQAEGYRLLKTAAEGGDVDSMRNYGLLLVQGNGYPKDAAAGAGFVRRAAFTGDARSQMLLGDLYNEAQGLPQSDQDAIYWWGLAERQGNEEAIETMAEVRRRGYNVNLPPLYGTGATPSQTAAAAANAGRRKK